MIDLIKKYFQKIKTLDFECFDKNGFTPLKLIIFLIHGFVNKDLTAKAASLTYYSFTCIVPFMSLFFCFSPRFGAEDMVPYLQAVFPYFSHLIASVFHVISRYGSEALAMTPWVHLVSVCMMVWCGYNLCFNIAHNLNVIWEVEDRPFGDRLKFYVVAFVGLAVLMSSVAPFVMQLPKVLGLNIAVYILLYVIITLMYKFGPNTAVSIEAALCAASIFVGLLVLMNWVFFWLYDVLVSTYVKNYGKTFFVVFMLFTWFQFIWIFFLIGSMVSCLIDKNSRYTLLNKQRRLSSSYKDYLKILVACVFYRKWLERDDCVKQEEIEKDKMIEDKLNYSLLREILKELETKEIIRLCRPKEWCGLPSIETVGDIMVRLDVKGEYKFIEHQEYGYSSELWKAYESQLISFYEPFVNKRLSDLEFLTVSSSLALTENSMMNRFNEKYKPGVAKLDEQPSSRRDSNYKRYFQKVASEVNKHLPRGVRGSE